MGTFRDTLRFAGPRTRRQFVYVDRRVSGFPLCSVPLLDWSGAWAMRLEQLLTLK